MSVSQDTFAISTFCRLRLQQPAIEFKVLHSNKLFIFMVRANVVTISLQVVSIQRWISCAEPVVFDVFVIPFSKTQ